ncbi:MAG: hypothetical protein NT002_12915 [candidate division Zixibacteria bacterium]|nr:hypothetical protein [candidate division Zixibacteria bacterium]
MRKTIHKSLALLLAVLLLLTLACTRRNPPRDEIPVIKNLLAKLDRAVKEQNAAAIDSLIIGEAFNQGYSSTKILDDVYAGGRSFYTFGRREFFYTRDRGVVNCFIMADSADIGRPTEITLVKAGDRWLIKRFDLK